MSGAFHQALNMAGLWRLPVLFVCENNHYATGTEIHRHSAVPEVCKRIAAYNIPAEKIDGMDVLEVYNAAKQALERIRRGGGPQFLECETYRYRGHSMADPGTYRPAVELRPAGGGRHGSAGRAGDQLCRRRRDRCAAGRAGGRRRAAARAGRASRADAGASRTRSAGAAGLVAGFGGVVGLGVSAPGEKARARF
jgi:hypothetical protein